MWRRGLAGLIAWTGTAALALGVIGCGSSLTSSSTAKRPTAQAASGRGLTVVPAVARPTSDVRFAFRAPSASGRQGRNAITYSLSVIGARRAGCVWAHDVPVSAPGAGREVSVTLGPAALGGRWCAGTYTARVDELARPACGGGQVCPQFIRIVVVLGPVRFRIAG